MIYFPFYPKKNMPKFPSSFQTACEVLSRNSWFLHVQTSLIFLGHTKVFQLWRNILCELRAASVFATLHIQSINYSAYLLTAATDTNFCSPHENCCPSCAATFSFGVTKLYFQPLRHDKYKYLIDLKYNNNNDKQYISQLYTCY